MTTLADLVIVDSDLDPDSMMFPEGMDLSRAPVWSVGEAVKTFFPHRTTYWVRIMEKAMGVQPERSIPGDRGGARRYDLRTIEQFTHRLAEAEVIPFDEMIRTLTIAKCIGVLCGVLPNETRIV